MTAASPEHAEALAVVQPAVAEINATLERLKTFAASIDSQEDIDFAGSLIEQLHTEVKDLKAKQETITKPQWQAWQAALALFRPAIKPREEAVTALKNGVAAALDRHRLAAEAALAAAAQTGDTEAIARVEETTVPKGLSVRHRRAYRVVDEALVPSRFKTINHALLANAIDSGETVPGVVITTESTVQPTGSRKKKGST